MIGLIDAAHRFDEDRGIKFETFAERRVRGAMIDALRKDAWPRGVRRQRRELEAAREELRRERAASRLWPIWPPASASDEKRLGRTIVRISTIESTSSCSSSPNGPTKSMLPAVCVPSETPTPGPRLRERRSPRPRARRHPVAAPARAQGDRALLLPRRHDEADRGRDRRQRIARLAAARPRHPAPAEGARPRWRQRAARRWRRSWQSCRGRARPSGRPIEYGRRPRGVLVPYPSHVADHAQQLRQPERLGQPAAAALVEEALGVGAGDVAGHEDHPPRQRRRSRSTMAR